jgi:hypothetical protein
MVSPALADGAAWADGQVLADPSLANGPVFAPSAATAGTAVVSASSDGPLENCSRHNPCAMPPPARDDVAVIAAQAAPVHTHHAAAVRSAGATGARHAMAVTPGLHS